MKAQELVPPVTKLVEGGSAVRMDPYVALTMDGHAAHIVKRSTTDKDGGCDPVWECPIEFDIVDQYLVDVEVFDQDLSGTDILLGTAQISLLPVFKSGESNIWLTLLLRREGFGVKETGAINFQLRFSGPPNIAFPQYRHDIDSFDDTLRTLNLENMIDKNAAAKEVDKKLMPEAGVADDVMSKIDPNAAPPEFTEEEIVSAFRFIDLDHNNFVGAAEIRHILVCMGELITDEEIDMMISMVDLDGDGQVSFSEFRTLVLHPNPGEMDIHRVILDEKEGNKIQASTVSKGKQKEIDAATFQRQKEMNIREAKKRMIKSFISDNDMVYDSFAKIADTYANLSKEKKVNGRVNFETFCSLTNVEPIGEYMTLFRLFDPQEEGHMDFREFILSSLNFVVVDKETRVSMAFRLYDEDKTGFISEREVEEILRGNHMLGLASVQRKAQTIMKQAASNDKGAITLQEFIVVTKKFPNIMLPVFNQSDGVAGGAD